MGCGAHLASYPMSIEVISEGVNRTERKVDHSAPSSAEVTNKWNYTSTPSMYHAMGTKALSLFLYVDLFHTAITFYFCWMSVANIYVILNRVNARIPNRPRTFISNYM